MRVTSYMGLFLHKCIFCTLMFYDTVFCFICRTVSCYRNKLNWLDMILFLANPMSNTSSF